MALQFISSLPGSRRASSRPSRRTFATLSGALILLGLATLATAAPEYALSGHAPQLAGVVLAQTPQGPVSALDLLMLDEMTGRNLAAIPMEAWLNPTAPEAKPSQPAIKTAIDRLAAYEALAARAGGWQPPQDQLEAMSYGAATAVWTENAVRPQIKITQTDVDRYYVAHPEKYLRRMRAQVRYIFSKANTADQKDLQLTRERLEDLAKKIKAGELTFEEAARSHSDAASAAQGGLIPPFYNGAFFTAFEDQTFALEKPGQTSPVFEGPQGLYLLQLVQSWPPHNIPFAEVSGEIRTQLQFDLVRSYYAYLYAKQAEQHFTRNNAVWWSYLSLDSPIAQMDKLALSRNDFLRFYSNPTGSSFEVNLPGVMADASSWIEGQVVLQDLRTRGLAQGPWIQRARQLAALPLKARQVYLREVPADSYRTTETAITTVMSNKSFAEGMRSSHILSFEVEIPKAEKLDPESLRESQTLAQGIATQITRGTLPVQPTPINLSEWLQKQAATEAQVSAAVASLEQALKDTPWPNLKIKVTDKGWVPLMPGTQFFDLFKNVKAGQATPPQLVGNRTSVHLILADRPVDPKEWSGKPMLLRALAFQLEASRIFQTELTRIRQGGQVQYKF